MHFLSFVMVLLVGVPVEAAGPTPYHLELEASPAAVFPYLSKFGTTEIHVYAGGARAEFLWLNAFSRNGAFDVTVTNPLGRMYVEVPIREIAPILRKLAGAAAKTEQAAAPEKIETIDGTVKGHAAKRHRLVYAPTAYVDYWTTTAVPENPQLRLIVGELLKGISPGTADVARTIRGTPIYVELNFRRFRKVPLLTMKKLTMSAEDEADALDRGPLFIRAGVLEKLWE